MTIQRSKRFLLCLKPLSRRRFRAISNGQRAIIIPSRLRIESLKAPHHKLHHVILKPDRASLNILREQFSLKQLNEPSIIRSIVHQIQYLFHSVFAQND